MVRAVGHTDCHARGATIEGTSGSAKASVPISEVRSRDRRLPRLRLGIDAPRPRQAEERYAVPAPVASDVRVEHDWHNTRDPENIAVQLEQAAILFVGVVDRKNESDWSNTMFLRIS